MDVVSFSPTAEEFLLDASIRNPLAKVYTIAAFYCRGFAARYGEQDKLTHYPPTSGKKAEPCVIESFGHICKRFLALLDQATFMARK